MRLGGSQAMCQPCCELVEYFIAICYLMLVKKTALMTPWRAWHPMQTGALICWMTQRQVVVLSPKVGTAKGEQPCYKHSAKQGKGAVPPCTSGDDSMLLKCVLPAGTGIQGMADWTLRGISYGCWDLYANTEGMYSLHLLQETAEDTMHVQHG